MARILVLGGDGFCGWPTSLHLSALGHDVAILDNLSRRRIDAQLGSDSLTPIASIETRIAAWSDLTGRDIAFYNTDAADFAALRQTLATVRPDTIIHFAEQRAAPYSMKGAEEKVYTVNNNIGTTHNLLAAVTELGLHTHIVHLGTMGVYGYDGDGLEIPEGYLNVYVPGDNKQIFQREILYPTNPGSVYHMTKSMDQLLFQFYAKNDRLRITDLHQGIVWGTQTEETRMDERLINRFDYDGDYGTVLNRFLMQAAIGHPLTVHGFGGQTRAFINIQDTVRCVALAVANPPEEGDRVKIINQMTETHRVRDLARLVSAVTGARVAMVENPRNEAPENELRVSNKTFLSLGLDPITLKNGLLDETLEISRKYAHRCRKDMIPCVSTWTQSQHPGVVSNEVPLFAVGK
ncbi:NAD-dependent epimerase/dehydratase family protein [Pseudooceanicola sp. CBS1P-1]|uniref:NAD-dependent epimerase/dehydratase family protein n=1 Tax=Pseudooceanicola albus TaxID=2692189 RepID=A0A6L7G1S9_9RHOB|nr:MULTISPECIES: NAD-dependent epimerase/dehydratase family protein [Pseudooceanicola]MBT9384981.1 NAD-dependent epimerase/dehydratase family protein [Pseudooceanicola endophyticus]MXN18025.1 NAD-dependent epimerase/dehydratase family protein [Pseudooceanicola albus]